MKNLLLVLLLSVFFNELQLFAQQERERLIKGIVIDDNKDPVIFASVIANNTLKGTTTDIDGRFQLIIPDSCESIIIICAGYLNQEVNIQDLDSIMVTMQAGIQLREVTVSGYSTPLMKYDKATQCGIRNAEQIRNLPVQSLDCIAAKTTGLSSIVDEVSIRRSGADATEYFIDGVTASKSYSITSFKSDITTETSSTDIVIHSKTTNLYSAGQLTAGEINDFGKWVLWNDKSQEELTDYRDDWKMYPSKRYMVIVQNNAGIPIVGQLVSLMDHKENPVWTAKTDNTGKAELWSNMFEETYQDEEKLDIVTKINDREHRIHHAKRIENGVNHITIESDCNHSNVVDAVFVVDATGSMTDELNYLKEELTDVMQKVKARHQALTLNLGSVFYRDHGDEYITRASELTANISKTIQFIQQQTAAGGGDEPEALDEALEIAIRNMNWSPDSRTKLLFVVMDAPPHISPAHLKRIRDVTWEAAKNGIRIIPLTASGIDKSAEYLMRSLALCTNGTYVFLTDHSGIGNPHLQPTTDSYHPDKLNDLIIRLFDQYVTVVSCHNDLTDNLQIIVDTTEIQYKQVTVTETGQENLPDEREHATEKLDLKYYPNPTTGILNITVKSKIKELFLCDASGKLLQRFDLNGENKLQLDISPYPVGTYRIMYFENIDEARGGTVVLVK